ncbi:serpin H1-like [Scleropages formosus]|uniref:Serpin H1-like n=1 Tax=Scleropages formosus TaxID=113540 RepID=A0A0P7XPL3_SCLFO|nr:serpin H1-like [Scleropages formosus]
MPDAEDGMCFCVQIPSSFLLLVRIMLVIVLALSLLVVAASSEDKVLTSHAFTMGEKSTKLTFSLYQSMAKEKDLGNIIFSPVVVASSLGLVTLGSKPSTASQVKTVFGANKLKDEHLHAGLAELVAELLMLPGRLAVSYMVPTLSTLLKTLSKPTRKHYNFEHSQVNFKDKPSAIKSINDLASKVTDGKLPEIIKDVENVAGAVIVNAMFFKTHWDEKFHHKMVDNCAFLVDRSSSVFISMMHHAVNSCLSKLEERVVSVSIPKVTMEVSHDLQVTPSALLGCRSKNSAGGCLQKKHLQEIGLTDVVNQTKADLSNISDEKDLYLSNIFHASAFEWDIEGNPSDASIFGTDKFHSPRLFYADHPCIFLVMDSKTRSILFVGRLIRPKGEKMKDELGANGEMQDRGVNG